MAELIIFDCDGVIVDSEPISCGAHVEVLAEEGIDISLADVYQRFTGCTVSFMMDTLEAEFNKKLPEDYLSRVDNLISSRKHAELKPIKGIKELLQKFYDDKQKICVASGSSPKHLALSLELAGVQDYFEGNYFSAHLVEKGKPAPDIFYYAAEKMQASPCRTIVIEDSANGVIGAKKAGMYVVGFTGGSHCTKDHADKLIKAGADSVISDMNELENVIKTNWL